MNKLLLPGLLATSMLISTPLTAKADPYHDPFDAFFDTMLFQPKRFDNVQFNGPKMDVADLGNEIEIKAELPGMDEKDITLTIEDGILTLSGERQQASVESSKDYYMKEISSGSFKRSIRLPKNADTSKTDAVFKKGILTITIPKIEIKEDNVKKIPIKTED